MEPAMHSPHHPKVQRRSDGRWKIRCPECLGRRDEAPPVGIGIPISGEFEARYIQQNHGGPTLPETSGNDDASGLTNWRPLSRLPPPRLLCEAIPRS